MPDPTQEPTPQPQKPITTIQIALGVAGGLALFIFGVNIIREANEISNGGPYQSQIQEIDKLRQETRQLNNEQQARRRDCSQYPCATITGETLVKWPLSVPAPVTVTCETNSRQFIQVGGKWFERSDKPESDLLSWLEVQKVEGVWPFQHRLSFEFLKEEIEKACRR